VDNTYSTKNPRKCIDYVFAYKDAAPVEVVSSEVLTSGTETLSDHFPVKVVVKIVR
jgi:endonuclease/exonuclease/phosphatase family metal-dependent hydrolase